LLLYAFETVKQAQQQTISAPKFQTFPGEEARTLPIPLALPTHLGAYDASSSEHPRRLGVRNYRHEKSAIAILARTCRENTERSHDLRIETFVNVVNSVTLNLRAGLNDRHSRPHFIILASCKPGVRLGLQPGFRQVRAGLRHDFDMLSTSFRLFLSKTWSRTCCINLDVRSSLGFKQVCSWLSTCFRHAFDLLATCFRHAHASRKPGLQPGLQPDLQVARIMECSLHSNADQI